MAVRCSVCSHPQLAYINTKLGELSTSYTLDDLVDELRAQLAQPPSRSALARHKKTHLSLELPQKKPSAILAHSAGLPDLPDALALIINTGLENVLRQPERVGVRALTDALGIYRDLIKMGAIRPKDETEDAWAAFSQTRQATITEVTNEQGSSYDFQKDATGSVD